MKHLSVAERETNIEDKRNHTRSPSEKSVVVGMKDREANKVVLKPVPERTKDEIHGFIGSKVLVKRKSIPNDHKSHGGLPYDHESVNHSIEEYSGIRFIRTGLNHFGRCLNVGTMVLTIK